MNKLQVMSEIINVAWHRVGTHKPATGILLQWSCELSEELEAYEREHDTTEYHLIHKCECGTVVMDTIVDRKRFEKSRDVAWGQLDRWGETENSPVVLDTSIIRYSCCDECREYWDGQMAELYEG
jgi:hypothetical protein